ncbi:MAG TPA: flavodoxin domain-containing protein, partial [Clostridia bacterium]
WNFRVVKTGDSIDIGNGKKLIFIEMKMLHWPDSMATYMTGDNILFSNDAFGQHYAEEELFNDKADQCLLWSEAMKYYANILNPFSPLVKKKVEEIKALNLPIDIIAPSHGSIWRDNPMQIVEKYYDWSQNYQEDQITIAYDTMWDGTKHLAHKIAAEISRLSANTKVKVYNISVTNKTEIMTEIFKSKAIAVGSPTVGNSILSSVAGWLEFLKELKFKNKKAAVFGCYGWSGESTKELRERLTSAGFKVIEPEIKCNWNPKEEDYNKAIDVAKALCD